MTSPVPLYATFETEMSVRPDDIDFHGHVHASKYQDYLLAARFDQMKRCYGMAMGDFHARGLSWFVKTAHFEYHRGLRLGESMVVRTRVAELHRRGVRVAFEILRLPDRKPAVAGWCDYVLIRLDDGRPVSVPEDIVQAYSI